VETRIPDGTIRHSQLGLEGWEFRESPYYATEKHILDHVCRNDYIYILYTVNTVIYILICMYMYYNVFQICGCTRSSWASFEVFLLPKIASRRRVHALLPSCFEVLDPSRGQQLVFRVLIPSSSAGVLGARFILVDWKIIVESIWFFIRIQIQYIYIIYIYIYTSYHEICLGVLKSWDSSDIPSFPMHWFSPFFFSIVSLQVMGHKDVLCGEGAADIFQC